ncbi:MAG: hypothetical protein HFJ44_07900 [Clostridia bacterium]|nr:hypothetical protein [Clostridia bacterium]
MKFAKQDYLQKRDIAVAESVTAKGDAKMADPAVEASTIMSKKELYRFSGGVPRIL